MISDLNKDRGFHNVSPPGVYIYPTQRLTFIF